MKKSSLAAQAMKRTVLELSALQQPYRKRCLVHTLLV